MRSSARLVAKAINHTNSAPSLVQDLPVNKPTPHLGASEREHCDGFMNSGSTNDMAVYLLDFLSVKELLRLRQVSKVWMKMIDGSTKYRKAAFLEAEVPGDPNFRASLLQPTIGSKTRDEQTSIDQRTVIPRQLFAIDVPMRSVRVNPLLFLTTHNQETDTLIPLLPLQSYGSSFMNDKSTCMDMFLTQPPIKEVRVEVRDSAVPVFGFPRLGGSRRRQVRHRNDGEEFTTSPPTAMDCAFETSTNTSAAPPMRQVTSNPVPYRGRTATFHDAE
ncbi:unnamed protein product [Zymoseptoria tritici ST99CH_1A5]|nr:unnamed protein product [Zymoseptoria tritici ST99CH_1A5]